MALPCMCVCVCAYACVHSDLSANSEIQDSV